MNFCAFSQVTMMANFPPTLTQGNPVIVDVKISKGAAKNFCKYQMDVPEGIVVSEVDSKEGNFTFEGNRAKIVWVSIPQEPEFTIKVKVYPSGSSPPSATITQKIALLLDGSKKEIEAPTVIISILEAQNIMGAKHKTVTPTETKIEASRIGEDPKSTSVIAKTEPEKQTEPAKAEPVKTEPAKTEPMKTEPMAVKTEPAKNPDPSNLPAGKTEKEPVKAPETPKIEASKVETPKTGLVASAAGLLYKVQLAAAPTESVKDKFVSLGSGLSVSREDGQFKVLYGTYNTKEEALKAREELITKGFTGFLVKYQNGVRIK
jgi:hypothetical protein